MNKNLYSLGLMSGTSMDGIDVSIIKSDGEQFIELVDDIYIKYDNQLKLKLKKIIDLCSSKDQFSKLSKEINGLEKEVTHCHVKACRLITEKNKNKNAANKFIIVDEVFNRVPIRLDYYDERKFKPGDKVEIIGAKLTGTTHDLCLQANFGRKIQKI